MSEKHTASYSGPDRVFSGVQPSGSLHLVAAAYFAAGVDPKKAVVYAQSSVRAHTELAWYFNCVARTGWLNRMTVMSLRDGTKKMSKSDPSDASRINLTDTPDQIAKKIRKAKTDAGAVPANAEEMEGRPDIANLIGIYSALSDRSEADIMNEHGGGQFGPFKATLADVAVETLRPVTDLMNRYLAAPDEIDLILSKAGEDAAEHRNLKRPH